MHFLRTLSILLVTAMTAQAAPQAFPQTPVDTIEVKTLPAATLIATESQDNYFDQNGTLFRPLFQYISRNDIAMTTPVEAEITPGKMYFYIGEDAAKRALESTETVSVYQFPQRLVLSIGTQGSYSRKNFETAKKSLQDWLAQQDQYQATGSARAIYWNGPFTLGPWKRAEVHIPIEPIN